MAKSHKRRFADFVISAMPGCVAIALITYFCFRSRLNLSVTGFLYLIVVVLQSLRGNFASSAFVSVLTVACLDFFFTPPVFSFEVTNSLDILALISYLITGLVITRLTTRVRKEAAVSDNQRRQVDLLYQLAKQLLALDPAGDLLHRSAERFREVFELNAVCFFDALSEEFYSAGKSVSGLSARTRSAYQLGQDEDDVAAGVTVRYLRATGKKIGAVGFEGLRGCELTIGPLAALAAAMLERTRAFRSASHAAATAQTEVFRGAVLDALAHEFKTPLATILTAAGGLREADPLRPQQLELAELIETEASRLSGLTSQVLRTSRLDRKDIKPRLMRTDITGLVSGLVDEYSRQCTDRKFVANGMISKEVLADRDLLELAIRQLLDNACKYSPRGSEIVVSVEGAGERAAVRVLNTGKPICGSERFRVFERFYRGAETLHLAPGSGLGLYFAHQIACAHGGSMELEDATAASEDATVFRLTLPLAKAQC